MCEISSFASGFFFFWVCVRAARVYLFVIFSLFFSGFADDDRDDGVVTQARGEQIAKSELRSLVRTSERCVRFFPSFLATFLLSSS
jgi:hypothetical protein